MWCNGGRFKVNVAQFTDFQQHAQIDMVACIADVQSNQASMKRTRKSVDRTIKFLDEVIDAWANKVCWF